MEESSEPKHLNLFPIDYPFETLVNRIDSDPPKLILDPEFQRKYKWDKKGWERASRFIESCLMRIPLPACYFAENTDGRHLVIDGVQRLTTVSKFFKDEFSLEGLTTFKELEGKKFSELGDYKSELESTTIRCIILRKENPKELIKEIFSRLNQGAVQLSGQEIRHAIYPGPFDKLLVELSESELIKNFGKGKAGTKVKDSRESEEQVLRFFALQGNLEDYDDRLNKLLDQFMKKHQNISDEKIDEFRNLFLSSLDKCIAVFGDEEIFMDPNKEKRKQSMVYYDLLMWSFSKRKKDFITNNKEKLKDAFAELCREERFKKTASGGLQKKSSILNRRSYWEEKITD